MIPLIYISATDYQKSKESGKTVSLEWKQKMSKSPKAHMAPSEGKSASAPGLKFRGLVMNANVPYIGEFTPAEKIEITNIHSNRNFEADGSAVYADGKFYTQWTYSPSIGAVYVGQSIYDAATWELLEERDGMMMSSAAVCMTYDPMDCVAYGYFQNDDGEGAEWLVFGRMNLATGDVYAYNSIDTDDCFMCIAASPDGYLYGVNVPGQFCRINKADGAVTVLGHTDVKPHYMQSATIDWETGDFYWACMTDAGESILYKINPTTYIAEKVGEFPKSEEFVGLYIVKETPSEKTAAAVKDITLTFDKDNLNGSVSAYAPETTVGGQKLSGKLKVHVAVDGTHYEAEANPGQKVEVPVKVRTGGLYIFSVWATEGNNEGEKATVQKWVGPDYPLAVNNLQLTNDNNHLKLAWEAPSSVGQHGGYVDVDNLSYMVSRTGAGIMKTVTLFNQFVFEQDIADGITDKVYFLVRAVNNELVGEFAYSNEVNVGNDVRSVPMSINAANISDFIVIDANKDRQTWQPYFGYAICETSKQADDWLLTPKVALNAGEIYELTYETSAKMGFLQPQTLEVKCGTGDDDASMTIDIDKIVETNLTQTQFNSNVVDFTVPSTGDYRIGFHNISEGGILTMAGISVKSKTTTDGPKAPTSCTVEAAPLGELKATIKFRAPLLTNENKPIEALSEIKVLRGSELIGKVENPTKGLASSVVDNNPQPGMNTYTIVAVDNKGNASANATAKGWVGVDVPSSPQQVTMVEKDGNLDLTWTMRSTGTHGGYVNLEEVVYSVVEPVMGSSIAGVVGQTEISIPIGELSRQAMVQYAVAASNSAGSNNEATLTPTLVIGPSIKLPFYEHFKPSSLDHTWRLVGEVEENYGWAPSADAGADSQPGVSTFFGQYAGDEQALTSGRISLKDAKNPALRFYYAGYIIDNQGWGAKFTAEVSESFERGWTKVFEYDFKDGDKNDWVPVEVSLAQYAGKDIFIRFHALPDDAMVVGVDNISIRSELEFDAAIDAISADVTEVDAGSVPAKITVRVENHGVANLEAGSYKVNFYAGDRKFAACDGKDMDASFGTSEYTVDYVADMDDADPVYVRAEIECAKDMYEGNDKSADIRIYVNKTYCPKVEDLAGTVENNQIVLRWTQPDQNGQPVRRVVEDFESYRNFATPNVGEWTIIDEDKSSGVLTSYFFPGSGGPLGWIVINPGGIPRADGGTHADRYPAYSGESYIAAFTPGAGNCKDWLITPELSGRAHEISFMARAESSKAGREMFEVYYSTTTPEIASMIRLDDKDWRTSLSGWDEFKFQVPEGAKYFAVRCVSHNRLVMHIDDFSYESAPTPLKVTLKGYNVYRDGKRLNEEPITVTEYRDATVSENDANDYKYTVRAVYDRGEAGHSNEVTLNMSGIEDVMGDYGINPYETAVYDLSGRRVYELKEGTVYVTKNKRFVYSEK